MRVEKNPGTEVPKSRHQRRYGRTRNRILVAARAIFSERGMSGIAIDEITERADVGRGSFYYHFGSMDKLVQAIIQDILDGLIERMESECQGKEQLEEMLDALISTHIGFFGDQWQDFVLYYQGRAELTLAQSYSGIEDPFLEYIGSIERLVGGVVSGPISKQKLRRLACAVAGFISGYYSFASIAPIGQDLDPELSPMRRAFVTSLARFARQNADGKEDSEK